MIPATASTSGVVVINLFEHWQYLWAREWGDIGKLIKLRAEEKHITRHMPYQFDPRTRGGWCECFECRVVEAWKQSTGKEG